MKRHMAGSAWASSSAPSTVSAAAAASTGTRLGATPCSDADSNKLRPQTATRASMTAMPAPCGVATGCDDRALGRARKKRTSSGFKRRIRPAVIAVAAATMPRASTGQVIGPASMQRARDRLPFVFRRKRGADAGGRIALHRGTQHVLQFGVVLLLDRVVQALQR